MAKTIHPVILNEVKDLNLLKYEILRSLRMTLYA